MRCNNHNRKILQIETYRNFDPSVSDGTPLVHCIQHHVVMGVSQTVIPIYANLLNHSGTLKLSRKANLAALSAMMSVLVNGHYMQ